MEKLLATSDYRKLNTAEKALKLYNEENLSKTKAGNITNTSRYTVSRAWKAANENREIGRNGRPSSLNDDEMDILIDYITYKIDSYDHPTYKDIKLKVNKILKLNKSLFYHILIVFLSK